MFLDIEVTKTLFLSYPANYLFYGLYYESDFTNNNSLY